MRSPSPVETSVDGGGFAGRLARVRDGNRPGLDLGRVRAGVLVRRPRALHGLSGDLQVVDELGPGPHRGTLAGLGGVLDDLVQPGVPGAMSTGLDRQCDPAPFATGDDCLSPGPSSADLLEPASTIGLGRRRFCGKAGDMATLTIDRDRLRVTFPLKEKMLGVVRDLDVPLSSVVSADQVRSWREV